MAQSTFLLFAFAVLFSLCNAQNYTVEADRPQYFNRPSLDTTWYFNLTADLRGFVIFDERFVIQPGEQILVYRRDGSLPKYFLANYTSTSTLPTKYQRLTADKGEGITVKYYNAFIPANATTTSTTTTTTTTTEGPTVTIATTTAPLPTGPTTQPPTFMFLVSAFNETASLMNNTDDSGTFTTKDISNTIDQTIQTHSNVTQIWHYYPATNNIRLSFSLIDSTALSSGAPATLTLYRGDANDISNTSTIIKIFNDSKDLSDKYTYGYTDYGQPLSLMFVYPVNQTNDPELGFRFLVSVLVLNSSDLFTIAPPATDSSGQPLTNQPTTITTTVPPSNNTGSTVTSTMSTTTSSAAPFFFSLAPIIISLIFQMCHTSTSSTS